MVGEGEVAALYPGFRSRICVPKSSDVGARKDRTADQRLLIFFPKSDVDLSPELIISTAQTRLGTRPWRDCDEKMLPKPRDGLRSANSATSSTRGRRSARHYKSEVVMSTQARIRLAGRPQDDEINYVVFNRWLKSYFAEL